MNWKILNKNFRDQDILQSILSSRGFNSDEEIEKFLNPQKTDLHDPFLIPDMKKGVDRILQARENGEKVVIYGDYDADGVTSTSILWKFLYRELGIDVVPYIPSRFDEGYGLNEEAIAQLIENGANLIITVDCGIKDSEIIKRFSKDVDFIVTDHHTLPEDQDFEHIAIHPLRADSKYPFQHLAGAGVAWKLVCAISEQLKNVKNAGSMKLDPFKYADLASIGTVTDVMPLVGENRTIVKFGLEEIRKAQNAGLKALMKVAGKDIEKADTYDIGFVIGPRINAAGRMEEALIAVKLFSTENEEAATKLASYLNGLNIQRQEETQIMMDGALVQISHEDNLLFAYDENWNEGIVGLVAGKLKETYYKPAIAATKSNGLIVGSARSIEGINITDVIGMQEKLLVRFGGHSQAAGLSVNESNLEELKTNLIEFIRDNFDEKLFERSLEIDMELTLAALNMKFYEKLMQLAPFGEGNREPIFAFRNLQIVKIFKFGQDEKHIKFIVTDKNNLPALPAGRQAGQAGKQFIQVLGFGKGKEFADIEIGNTIDIAGKISLNEWNGQKSLQIVLSDLKKSK